MKALSLAALLAGARCVAADAAPVETADSVLAKAASAYTSANAIEVRAYTRMVMVGLPNMQEVGMNRMTRRSFLLFRMRKPDDWYAAAWDSTRVTNPGAMNRPGAPTSGTPSDSVAYQGRYVMAKSQGSAARLNGFSEEIAPGKGIKLSDAAFAQRLRDQLVSLSSTYLALAPLLDADAGSVFDLSDPNIVAAETWNGHDTWRIEGTNPHGSTVELWIERSSGLVLRTVTTNRIPAAARMPHPVTETIYKTTLGGTPAADDFALKPPTDALLRLTVAKSDDDIGFGRASDLAQYGGQAPAPAQTQSSPFGTPTPPAPVAITPAPAPVAPLAQALSPEQMAGIVLINGDAGTATGFMTKIHGIDFVVTNEHVIGENKRITVQDMSGNTLPVLATFGAVGRDVAILRIAKGAGALTTNTDVFKNVKIGDSVVVVGNKLGGGVATQASGRVLGVGPIRIEIDANFEPGNSGSPIFDLATHDVVGVAAYQETRTINVSAGGAGSTRGRNRRGGGEDGESQSQPQTAEVDKRWFGFRLDGITQWQAIDMDRWHAQSERIAKFRALSDALVDFIHLKFDKAAENDQLAPYITSFEARAAQLGNNRVGIANVFKDMVRTVSSVASAGMDDFASDDYYDYYRTCLYWEDSVPMQIEYRKAIVAALSKYENLSLNYVSRLGNGSSE